MISGSFTGSGIPILRVRSSDWPGIRSIHGKKSDDYKGAADAEI
jgi:hypothetical protein